MTPSRKQPSAAFWATVVAVAVLVGYPVSIGPACWIASRAQPTGEFVSAVYCPIIWIWHRAPPPLYNAIATYIGIGIPEGTIVIYGDGRPTIRFE